MGDEGETLKSICDKVLRDPELAPLRDKKTGKITATHCNTSSLLVAVTMGCLEFSSAGESLLADAMVAVMRENRSGCWKKVDGSTASIHALSGCLAFAAMSSEDLKEAHGHIAPLYPVGMQFSGSFKKDVPMVANVGIVQELETVSRAFPVTRGEPSYFTWTKPKEA